VKERRPTNPLSILGWRKEWTSGSKGTILLFTKEEELHVIILNERSKMNCGARKKVLLTSLRKEKIY